MDGDAGESVMVTRCCDRLFHSLVGFSAVRAGEDDAEDKGALAYA